MINKSFNNFLQGLAEELRNYKGISVIYIPGRANSLADTLTRSLDNVSLELTDTSLSKEQAQILPSVFALKPGTTISNEAMMKLLNAVPAPEFFYCAESAYRYVQKVDFKLYNDQQQLYALETEFILGALLNHDPDTVFKLSTWRDL